jgi:hypothetical protein
MVEYAEAGLYHALFPSIFGFSSKMAIGNAIRRAYWVWNRGIGEFGIGANIQPDGERMSPAGNCTPAMFGIGFDARAHSCSPSWMTTASKPAWRRGERP